MAQIDWNPDRRKLAVFSRIGFAFLAVVGALAVYRHGNWTLAAVLWAAAVAIFLLGAFRPLMLKPVFVGLTILTFPIGWAVSNLALAAIFYLVFTPIAFWFRLIRRDALRLRPDLSRGSCWIAYPVKPPPPASYYRPF